jgi:hypothetical protein
MGGGSSSGTSAAGIGSIRTLPAGLPGGGSPSPPGSTARLATDSPPRRNRWQVAQAARLPVRSAIADRAVIRPRRRRHPLEEPMTTLANPEKRLPQTPRPKARLGFNTRVSFSEHTGGPGPRTARRRRTVQGGRPDRHPAALAAGPDLGLHRRPAAIAGMPAHRQPGRRVPAGRHRAGGLPGAGGSGRRSRPCCPAPRAHGPLRRRPAAPRARGPALPGGQAAWRRREHRHHHHLVYGVQRRLQAAAGRP